MGVIWGTGSVAKHGWGGGGDGVVGGSWIHGDLQCEVATVRVVMVVGLIQNWAVKIKEDPLMEWQVDLKGEDLSP